MASSRKSALTSHQPSIKINCPDTSQDAQKSPTALYRTYSDSLLPSNPEPSTHNGLFQLACCRFWPRAGRKSKTPARDHRIGTNHTASPHFCDRSSTDTPAFLGTPPALFTKGKLFRTLFKDYRNLYFQASTCILFKKVKINYYEPDTF